MAEHGINPENSGKNTALEEYVTVAIAEDMELAQEYRGVLENSGIDVVLRTQRRDFSEEILGVAVMVPGPSTDSAQELIESQQAFDDFLDNAFNQEEDESDDDCDFEANFFDEIY